MQIQQYTAIHQFEPLLPQARLDEFRQRGKVIIANSMQIAGGAHPHVLALIRELVRAMNSYYSNRIEGQSTHPANIERALRHDFSERPDVARLQRIALAHIDAERKLENQIVAGDNALMSDFLQSAHHRMYSGLARDDRCVSDGRVIEPGQWRTEQVAVGRHEPPTWSALPRFLARMDEVYGAPCSLDDTMIYIAAAHHRAAWVHPFLDGNGRAVRLQTHCAIWPFSAGLWSMSRGIARQQERYYAKLDAADSPRQDDLDGRGNLSERCFGDWCDWFISVAEDQVSFMRKMLTLDEMKSRIAALIHFRAQFDKLIRIEAALPLYHLFVGGSTSRGEFQQMTGLGERTARTLLSRLIETKLVSSVGHTAKVSIAFPLDALQFLFPELYPEAATTA